MPGPFPQSFLNCAFEVWWQEPRVSMNEAISVTWQQRSGNECCCTRASLAWIPQGEAEVFLAIFSNQMVLELCI